MARQPTHSQSFKSIARAALVGCGIFVLFGYLGGAAAQFNHILCATAGEALGALPSIARWPGKQCRRMVLITIFWSVSSICC